MVQKTRRLLTSRNRASVASPIASSRRSVFSNPMSMRETEIDNGDVFLSEEEVEDKRELINDQIKNVSENKLNSFGFDEMINHRKRMELSENFRVADLVRF